MNAIVIKGWPLVHITFSSKPSDNEASAWLKALTALLDKEQRFSIVISTTSDSQLSSESQKAQSLWFKKEHIRIGQYCVGMARVLLDINDIERLAGQNMQKAMPMPLFATIDEAEAMRWAQHQLDHHNKKNTHR